MLIVRADYVVVVEDLGKSISPLEVYKEALWLYKHMFKNRWITQDIFHYDIVKEIVTVYTKENLQL